MNAQPSYIQVHNNTMNQMRNCAKVMSLNNLSTSIMRSGYCGR
jgi:hypothetical protein